MTTAFFIRSASPSGAGVEITRPYYLPGVKCSVTGAWIRGGISYPTLGVEIFRQLGLAAQAPPLTPSEFRDLAARFAALSGGRRIEPGSTLGAASGRILGAVSEVVWLPDWSLAVSERIAEDCAKRRLGVFAAKTTVSCDRSLYEIEAWPEVVATGISLGEECDDRCGRRIREYLDPWARPEPGMRLELRKGQADKELWRIREFPAVLVCSAVLREVLGSAGATALEFLPVDLDLI